MSQMGLICKLNYLDVTQIFNRLHVQLEYDTLASGKQVKLGSGGCTESSLSLLYTSRYFEAYGVKRFHPQEVCTWDHAVKNEEIYGIVIGTSLLCSFFTYYAMLCYSAHKIYLLCSILCSRMKIVLSLLSQFINKFA